MPSTEAFGRQRQAGLCEFPVSQGYIVRPLSLETEGGEGEREIDR